MWPPNPVPPKKQNVLQKAFSIPAGLTFGSDSTLRGYFSSHVWKGPRRREGERGGRKTGRERERERERERALQPRRVRPHTVRSPSATAPACRWGILSRALEAAVRSAPSWLLGALSRVPSRLPRLSYRVMVLTGLGEAGVSYGTAVSWARHLAAMDPDSFRSFLLAAQAHSLDEDTLSRIDAPVLVVSGGRDVFSPPVHSERLVRGLRRARRLHLEAASHMGLAGHATVLLEAIKDFVKDLQAETPGIPVVS